MKQNFLIAFFMFSFVSTFSQQISSDLISVSGNHDSNQYNQLTWIIGEPIIETLSEVEYILTQGLLQSNLKITSLDEIQINGLEFTIFPNPTRDLLNIVFRENINIALNYSITDITGKIISNGSIESIDNFKQIDFTDITPGIYTITFLSNNQIQSYQIIKK